MSNFNPDQPIVVNGNQLPGIAAALLRYVAAPLGGFLVGRGWIMADQVPQVAGVLMAVASAAWGLYSTFVNKKKLIVVAEAAPNKVAQVK